MWYLWLTSIKVWTQTHALSAPIRAMDHGKGHFWQEFFLQCWREEHWRGERKWLPVRCRTNTRCGRDFTLWFIVFNSLHMCKYCTGSTWWTWLMCSVFKSLTWLTYKLLWWIQFFPSDSALVYFGYGKDVIYLQVNALGVIVILVCFSLELWFCVKEKLVDDVDHDPCCLVLSLETGKIVLETVDRQFGNCFTSPDPGPINKISPKPNFSM